MRSAQTLSYLLACTGLASTHIVGLAPFGDFGSYLAMSESTFPLTFLTLNSQQPQYVSVSQHPASSSFLTARFIWDWSSAIGVRPANATADESALGTWLANVDFVYLDQDLTGNGNFTVDIPLPASALGNNPGPYVITAAVLYSIDQNQSTLLNFFNVTFTVEVANHA